MKVTVMAHNPETGKKEAIHWPTLSISFLFFIAPNSLKLIHRRLVNISMLPPRIASRLGVMPHSEILTTMTDKAIPLTINVTTDKLNNRNVPVLSPLIFEISVVENRISAITPINNILKTRRKSRSLYGSFPV